MDLVPLFNCTLGYALVLERNSCGGGSVDKGRERLSRPRNTEPQANGALARALRRRNPNWNDKTVHAERTNVIQLGVPGTGAGKRPDILIAPPRRQPVILETEFAPAHTVDQDATARLGTSLHTTGEDIEGVLVRCPAGEPQDRRPRNRRQSRVPLRHALLGLQGREHPLAARAKVA